MAFSVAQRKQKRSEARDIGKPPRPLHGKERTACEFDLERFALMFFPQTFTLALSECHHETFAKIQSSILDGILYVLALPRGSGKTSIVAVSILWAILYGHKRFIPVIAANKELAEDINQSILSELQENEKLCEAFPEAVWPFTKIEHVNQAAGQLCSGVKTGISCKLSKMVFPNIKGSKCAGSAIKAFGLKGAIRGGRQAMPNGEKIRPDFFFIDDPQSDEDAFSETTCAKKERLIQSAVLGLSGPGKKLSGVMACTVIRAGDLADRYLKGLAGPEFIATRYAFLKSWPVEKALPLWEKYLDVRSKEVREHGDSKDCSWSKSNAFYKANRKAMDEGAKAYWPERLEHGAISAIQSAYNLIFRHGKDAFMSEYQNAPLETDSKLEIPKYEDLLVKGNGYAEFIVPAEAQYLIFSTDSQKNVLFWMLSAWADGVTGWIVAYGSYPEQPLPVFDAGDPPIKLSSRYSGTSPAILTAALRDLIHTYGQREYQRVGSMERVTPALQYCDSGYEGATVYNVKRILKLATMFPVKGLGITASKKPISAFKRKPGEYYGEHWYCPTVKGTREFPHIEIDVNYWKGQVAKALCNFSGAGSITFHGDAKTERRILADHLTAETYVETIGQGRRVQEWKLKPTRHENHLFDCLVYAAAAASRLGMKLEASQLQPERRVVSGSRPAHRRMKLSDLQAQRRKERETA